MIVDEAHSSQGGEASKDMKKVLAPRDLENAAGDEDEEDDLEDRVAEVRALAESRRTSRSSRSPRRRSRRRWRCSVGRGPTESRIPDWVRPVVQRALANPLDNFAVSMEAKVKDLMTDRLDQNQELVMRFLNDEQFQRVVFPLLVRDIYEAIRRRSADVAL